MSKHKALELAKQLDDLHEVEERPIDKETAAELRTMHDREQRQHALIVQMREALKPAEDTLSHRPWSAEIWPNGTHPMRGITAIRDALAAADQYLGEKS